MTRNQYEHHVEQMEAYRAEFAEHWKFIKRNMPYDIDPRELAVLEFEEWKRWMDERKTLKW